MSNLDFTAKIVRAEGPNTLVDAYEGEIFVGLEAANRVLCRFAADLADCGGACNKIEILVTHLPTGEQWSCRYDVRSILVEIPNIADRIRLYCTGPERCPETFFAMYRSEEAREEARIVCAKWIALLEGC